MKHTPRFIAFQIIKEVRYNDGYSNLLLKDRLNNLSSVDKKLVTNIVYGTLKNYELLFFQLNNVKYKKLSKNQEVIILMSLYQYHFLDKIPDYAIVNEAINIVKKIEGHYDSKFVNALLKKLLTFDLVYANTNELLADLSINYSTPLWLVKMVEKQYSIDFLKEYLSDNFKSPKTFVRYNTLSNERSLLIEPDYTLIQDNCYVYNGDSLSDLDLYNKGIISIQDYSSQQVASFLDPQPNSLTLDMCAAPGNKTCALAEKMNNIGCIDAFDIHDHKIELINKQANRLKIDIVNARNYDATKLLDLYQKETFDYILCDAPCTGLGVIKRKPEIKYHNPDNMDELIKTQQYLLEVAYSLLKQGGTLVYSTCTINKKENEKQVELLLKKNDNAKLIAQKYVFQMEKDCDSFYMAKITKS